MNSLEINNEHYYLGCITKTHGVKGQVSIYLDVDIPEKYAKLESVFIEIDKQLVPFFIEDIRLTPKKQAVVAFEDINTFEKAQKLVKAKLFLPIETLPKLENNQFYYHEITGFKVTDKKHGEIGAVKQVLEYPGQSVIQVMKGVTEILIPISDQIIEKVDRKNKTIKINAPEGLIELYLNL